MPCSYCKPQPPPPSTLSLSSVGYQRPAPPSPPAWRFWAMAILGRGVCWLTTAHPDPVRMCNHMQSMYVSMKALYLSICPSIMSNTLLTYCSYFRHHLVISTLHLPAWLFLSLCLCLHCHLSPLHLDPSTVPPAHPTPTFAALTFVLVQKRFPLMPLSANEL